MRAIPSTDLATSARPGRVAFTLIELLVVISIMGVLAGLVVGLSGIATSKGRESRVRADLEKIVTAIHDYRGRIGFFPPDNGANKIPGGAVNPVTNQLYYELSGTVLTNNQQMFYTLDGREKIEPSAIARFFRADGFVNSSTDASQVRNYIAWLSSSQYKEINQSPDVEVLVAPVSWDPKGPNPPFASLSDPARQRLNPWRYVSTNPTNNPGSFDLWAEVWIGGKLKTIGNWKE